jgi:hypothetical protein
VKGSHQHAELKRVYALERGLAQRTAQLHAKQGHPDWVQFVAVRAGAALKEEEPGKDGVQALAIRMEGLTGNPEAGGKLCAEAESVGLGRGAGAAVVAPEAMSKAPELRTVEEFAECEAWAGLVEAYRQMRIAMQSGSSMEAVGFVKIAGDALKTYHLARDKRVRAEIEMGRLKPVSAWQGIKSGVAKVAGLVANLTEIAAAANPENPLVAMRAIENWLHGRFVPEVERIQSEVEGTLLAA